MLVKWSEFSESLNSDYEAQTDKKSPFLLNNQISWQNNENSTNVL